MAAPITVPFHTSIKITPAPNIKENTKVNNRTYILLVKIRNSLSLFVKNGRTAAASFIPYCAPHSLKLEGLFIIQYVSICVLKLSVVGRTLYQKAKATVNPIKSQRKAYSACLWSFKSCQLPLFFVILLSSSLKV